MKLGLSIALIAAGLTSAANAQVCPPDSAAATQYLRTLRATNQEPWYGAVKVTYGASERKFLGAKPTHVVAYEREGRASQIIIGLPFASETTYMDRFKAAYPEKTMCLRDQCFFQLRDTPDGVLFNATALRGDRAGFREVSIDNSPHLSCVYIPS